MSRDHRTLGDVYDPRKNNFNLLRLAFALLVILSHSYLLLLGMDGKKLEPLYRLSNGQIDLGMLAVNGFFMISGFLLVSSWENSHGLFNFLGRRALRIYPGLIVCLLFCVFIVGPLGGADLRTYFANPETYLPLRYVFMRNFWNSVPGVFSHNPFPDALNASLWTIKYEIFCYIVLALLGLCRLLKPLAVSFVFLGTWVLFNILILRNMEPLFLVETLPRTVSDFLVDPMPRFLTFFIAGSLFYLWRSVIPLSSLLFGVSIGFIVACFHAGLYLTLPIFGGYCLFYLSLTPRLYFPWLGSHDYSYGVYLYAWPVQQLMVYHGLGPGKSPLLFFVMALPPVFLLAVISWYGIEKPCLKFKKRQLKTASPAAVGETAGPG